MFARRHVVVQRDRPVALRVQVGQVREVGQVAEHVLAQQRPVHAVRGQQLLGLIERHVHARREHHVVLVLGPHLPPLPGVRVHAGHRVAIHVPFQVRRSVAPHQQRPVAAQHYHVLVPRRYVHAPPVAVVRLQYATALALIAAVQSRYRHAVDLAAVHVTLERLLLVAELAPERVRDVYAHALGTVERAGQRLAVVPDARVLFRVLRVEPETRFVDKVRTVLEQQCRPVLPDVDVDLRAAAGRFAQAPFAARAPDALLRRHVPGGGAYHRVLRYARLELPHGGHVNGHGQIHDGHAAEHGGHLAHAYRAAYARVLRRHHQLLDGYRFFFRHRFAR